MSRPGADYPGRKDVSCLLEKNPYSREEDGRLALQGGTVGHDGPVRCLQGNWHRGRLLTPGSCSTVWGRGRCDMTTCCCNSASTVRCLATTHLQAVGAASVTIASISRYVSGRDWILLWRAWQRGPKRPSPLISLFLGAVAHLNRVQTESRKQIGFDRHLLGSP